MARTYTTTQVVLIVAIVLVLVGFVGYARGADAEDGQATDPQPPVIVIVDRD